MPLIKVKKGLLEQENFYLTSPATDFLGTGEWIRTDTTFNLKNGTVKRRLPQSNFVIDVSKKILFPETEPEKSLCEFFIESNNEKWGLKETISDETAYWRIICYDGFIQIYFLIYEETWINNGGSEISLGENVYQGFTVNDCELSIDGYKLYDNPYLELQNFEPGTAVQLLDIESNLIKERLFNEDYTAKIFLDSCTKGYLKFIYNNEEIFTSSIIDFDLGDVFLFSNENIELIYKGKVLTFETTKVSKDEIEQFIIRNAGKDEIFDINIEVLSSNGDLVHISFDNAEYSNILNIENMLASEERIFYLKIIKQVAADNFSVKKFDIKIY